jgi:4-hydroxysphinganine ceramide fatty acyl 2-hydroxylase
MPPTLFFLLSFPFTRLAYVLFPTAWANGIISGSFAFCKFNTFIKPVDNSDLAADVLYDCMHYA